eukprot:6194424-Pleurochrysis_carterae.AAC.3
MSRRGAAAIASFGFAVTAARGAGSGAAGRIRRSLSASHASCTLDPTLLTSFRPTRDQGQDEQGRVQPMRVKVAAAS